MAQWCACELPLKALIALRRHFKRPCSCRSRRASLQHTTMWIDKSAKVLHASAIAVRQEKLALERSSAAQAQGGETAEVPQPGTPAHDPRDDSPTPRPGSQSPAKPREAENASTILPLNGSAGRDTPNRLDGAQGTPNDSTHGARGAVVGAHRVDRGDDDGHRAESAREAHGDEDGNVSGQEGTSATRAEAVSDEDVGTSVPQTWVRKSPSLPEIEIGKINSEVLEGCGECLRALYDSGFTLKGFSPCVKHSGRT